LGLVATSPANVVSESHPALGSAGESALRRENARLNDESMSLAAQLAEAFEELALIRSLAKHVALPDSAAASLEVARGILSQLLPVTDAQGLVLVLSGTEDGPAPDDLSELYGRILWTDQRVLDDPQCWRLIHTHRDAAAARPVVRNADALSRLDERIEGLREFMMAEVRSHNRLFGWLAACNRQYNQLPSGHLAQEGFTTIQSTLLVTAASMLAANLHNVELLRQKEALFTDMVRALVGALDARDRYTCGHSERVARLVRRLGEQIGLDGPQLEQLYLAGLLHDVGKIAVSDTLLKKPERLTDEEFAALARHPVIGWSMLHELPALRHVAAGVLHHHECYDGSGYPDRLAGEAIPLDARIIAICDAYDAMTSDRPYRSGMPDQLAVSVLSKAAGSQWDPRLVEAFLACLADMATIRRQYRGRVPDMIR
jgi:HD-GYP domain-containing protein (c-di-GMP phosphodiesterase class II)